MKVEYRDCRKEKGSVWEGRGKWDGREGRKERESRNGNRKGERDRRNIVQYEY